MAPLSQALRISVDSSSDALVGTKRKRTGKGATQYRGVRLRPWGTYGAEIRHPQSGARVWLGEGLMHVLLLKLSNIGRTYTRSQVIHIPGA